MKIVKSLDEYGSLIKGVRETFKNKENEPKGKLLGMLLGTDNVIRCYFIRKSVNR